MSDLEFQISQYADGSLDEAARAALELQLKDDARARELLAEYQNLDAYVARVKAPLPPVDWSGFADRISRSLTDAEPSERSYRLIPAWSPARFALAASVLIASALGLSMLVAHQHSTAPTPAVVAQVPTTILEISGPKVETPLSGTAVAEVSIGPSKQVAEGSSVSRYSDELVSRPSRLVLASGVGSSHDLSPLPY